MSQFLQKLSKIVGNTTAEAADDEPESDVRPFDSLPDEMIVHVLSSADADSLLICRLVCKRWQLLADAYAFQEKASRDNYKVHQTSVKPGFYSFSAIDASTVKKLDLPWFVFYVICKYDPFNRNLVKNHCGQSKLDHWLVLDHENGWAVENPPEGTHVLPECTDFEGHKCCFVSSYRKCSKEQTIEFKMHGLTENIMKLLQPDVVFSEWYSGRFDCGCKYELRVMLFDKNDQLIEQHNYTDMLRQWEGDKWTKVSHSFKNQSHASRAIVYHTGVDTQFWAGFYGAKISGTVVKVELPIKLKAT